MSWTLRCLNKKCGKLFMASRSADDPCPKCKGKRTRWIPAGIAISSMARGVDQTARALAGDYNMTNFASPEANLAAKRIATPSKTVNFTPQGAPGWTIPLPVGPDGRAGAACAPTGQSVKIKPQDGTVGKVTLPGPTPMVEGRFRTPQK